MSRDMPRRLGGSLKIALGTGGCGARVSTQNRVATSFNESSTTGFTEWDMREYWQLRETMLLLGGIENFADNSNREHLDFRTPNGYVLLQPGINYYLGSKFLFEGKRPATASAVREYRFRYFLTDLQAHGRGWSGVQAIAQGKADRAGAGFSAAEFDGLDQLLHTEQLGFGIQVDHQWVASATAARAYFADRGSVVKDQVAIRFDFEHAADGKAVTGVGIASHLHLEKASREVRTIRIFHGGRARQHTAGAPDVYPWELGSETSGAVLATRRR